MQVLERLTREAVQLAEGEVARQMQICNACRYCEGFCAVFPAMTRRLEFSANDVHYLANLCHNCGACLHACQYAPPHEFAVNIPQSMARVRRHTYERFAWPDGLGVLYWRNGLTVSLALALGIALFLMLAIWLHDGYQPGVAGQSFYNVFPHGLMVSMFLPVFGFAALALALGVRRFWRQVDDPRDGGVTAPAAAEAVHDTLRLKYLDGGHGEGCANDDDRSTLWRRRFHHFTFYGFLLCFAATSVATLYHYGFGWVAPYGYDTLPKWLGIAGGLGLLIGPAGLWTLNLRRHPDHGDGTQRAMDWGFIALLFGTSATGLALMLSRGAASMPWWLALHLGFVMAFFITMPYGKFAHGIYRAAALLKHAIERRQPSRLRLGSE